jgi:hypothetical protein
METFTCPRNREEKCIMFETTIYQENCLKCPNGHDVSPPEKLIANVKGLAFCTTCGAKLIQSILVSKQLCCSKCKNPVTILWRFCPTCGERGDDGGGQNKLCTEENPCCNRKGEYNGFGPGPLNFVCPKHCPCHD